tara:strand:+ start:2339 stop:2533 length:195 start_codon:yes stop_codon:yes gene_type:complete
MVHCCGECLHHNLVFDGVSRNISAMGTPKDEFNTKAWGLWITPQKEDIKGKQHINTKQPGYTSA